MATDTPLMSPVEVAIYLRQFFNKDRIKWKTKRDPETGEYVKVQIVEARAGDPDYEWVYRRRYGYLRPAARWVGGRLLFDRATIERLVEQGEGADRTQDRARKRNGAENI